MKTTISILIAVSTGFFFMVSGYASEAVELNDQETLSPTQLVEMVLDRNAGLAAMQEAINVARFRIDPASSLNDPTISLGLAPNTVGDDMLGSRGQFQFSQALPWPGVLRQQERVAQARADSVMQDEKTMRLELRAMTLLGYADWYLVHHAIRVNQSHQSALLELQRIAETRYAVGKSSQQDALQADIERTKLKQQFLRLEQVQVTVQARINALLNRAPDTTLPVPHPFNDQLLVPSVDELVTQVRDSHPAFLSAMFQKRAVEAQLRVEEKLRYPQFTVSAGYNGVLDPVEKRAILGVSMNVPLDQSKRRSAINASRAQVRRAEHMIEDVFTRLISRIFSDHAAVLESNKQIMLIENELLPLAAETLAASRSDYYSGRGDFLNVITAEQNLLDVELDLVGARTDYLRRIALLEQSSGFPFIDVHSGNDLGVMQ